METVQDYQFKVFLSYHQRENDLDGFQEALSGVDIVIPELIGWDETILAGYNQVSQGLSKAEQTRQFHYYDKFAQKRLKMLEGSRATIGFVDPPYGSRVYWLEMKALDAGLRAAGTKEEVVEEVLGYIQFISDADQQREGYVGRQLYPTINDIRSQNPNIAEKERPQVLIQFGIGHKGFFEKKFDNLPNTKFIFDPTSDVLTYTEEAMMLAQNGQTINSYLALKVAWNSWTDFRLSQYWPKVSTFTHQSIRFNRQLADNLSEDELWQVLQENQTTRTTDIVSRLIPGLKADLLTSGVDTDKLLSLMNTF